MYALRGTGTDPQRPQFIDKSSSFKDSIFIHVEGTEPVSWLLLRYRNLTLFSDIQAEGRMPTNKLRDRSRPMRALEVKGEGSEPEKPLAERFR
jgi:hypothetical protein